MKKLIYIFAAAVSVFAMETLSARSEMPDDGGAGITPGRGFWAGSVRWAPVNVGEKGSFAGQSYDAGAWFSFDEARDACPPGWRLPSAREWRALLALPDEWFVVNDVPGRKFTNGENTLFLPAAGYFNLSKGDMGIGSAGRYWSSTLQGLYGTCHLQFGGSGAVVTISDSGTNNFFVRCVTEN